MPRIPSDDDADALIATYRRAQLRLRALLAASLERGALGTAGYYARQLEAASAVLARLERQSSPLIERAIRSAYRHGAELVDAQLGPASTFASQVNAAGRFAGVHEAAVARFANELDRRAVAARRTVGRNVDDAFRAIGRREVATGIAAGLARVDVSDALERELMADGLTAFTDRAGRRWGLDTYSAMVARTTTREAVTQGTVNRMLELGADVVEISSHANSCPICLPFQGRRYSLTGSSEDGYPPAIDLPPYHPNCRHVATPAPLFDAPEPEQSPTPEPTKPPEPAPAEPARPAELGGDAEVASLPEPPPPPPAVEVGVDVRGRVQLPDPRYAREADVERLRIIDDQLEAIDSVHAWPSTDRIPSARISLEDWPRNPNRAGMLTSGASARMVDGELEFFVSTAQIGLSRELLAANPSVAHELGHLLDRGNFGSKLLGTDRQIIAGEKFTSGLADARLPADVKAWRQAVKASDRYRVFRRDPNYLGEPTELFARSYEQWIAIRSGNARLLAKIENNALYWPPEEFEPIAEALDALFRGRGLLRG